MASDRHRRAYQDIGLSGIPMQQCLERGQQHREQGRAAAPRQRLQARRKPGPDLARSDLEPQCSFSV
jgi:hypothetical protein